MTAERGAPSEIQVSRGSFLRRRRVELVILLIWLAAVWAGSAQHVIWRDEMRAMSVAKTGSLADLFSNLRYEGHPIVWYLLLRAAYAVVHDPLVLKLVSVAVALGASALFLFRAPFPLWFRCIVIFGLPFFEYSVVTRNYGISMLVCFAFADVFSRRPNSIVPGVILLLLANTNAHSVILTALLLGIWCFDPIARQMGGSRTLATAGKVLALAGIVFSVVTVGRGSGGSQLRHEKSVTEIARSLPAIMANPGGKVMALTGMDQPEAILTAPGRPAWLRLAGAAATEMVATALVFLAIAGLWGRLLMIGAALCAFWGFGLFFEVVYQGYFRHESLLAVFLLTLYWIRRSQPTPEPSGTGSPDRRTLPQRLQRLSFRLMTPLCIMILLNGVAKSVAQWKRPASSSRDLARFLTSRADLRNATLIAVPDYMLEAVPYYSKNPIHFLCSPDSAEYVDFQPRGKCSWTIARVVAEAQRIQAASAHPVGLLLAPDFSEASGQSREDYESFSWSPADLAVLKNKTRRVASFRAAKTDENYDLYLLQ